MSTTEVGPWVASGIGLSSDDTNVLTSTFQQYIQILGTNVVYNTRVSTGTDSYGMNTFSFSSSTIIAVVTNLSENDYAYVEPGLLPSMYSALWVSQVVPQVGDRVIWKNTDWEIRQSFPNVIASADVYYRCIMKRIITENLGAGG